MADIEKHLDRALKATKSALDETGKRDSKKVLKIAGQIINANEELRNFAAAYVDKKSNYKKQLKDMKKEIKAMDSQIKKLVKCVAEAKDDLSGFQKLKKKNEKQSQTIKRRESLQKKVKQLQELKIGCAQIQIAMTKKYGKSRADWPV